MRNTISIIFTTVLLGTLGITSNVYADPSFFVGIGDLPGGGFFSSALGISADGKTAVGRSEISSTDTHAIMWTESDGLVSLGTLPGHTRSTAQGASADGQVIVGWSSVILGEAFRWTPNTGMQSLGFLPGANLPVSIATAVSDDGSVVVGHGRSADSGTNLEAFLWTQSTGMQGLGSLPGSFGSEAADVSGDGSVVVGRSINTAMKWTTTDGMVSLGDLPGGTAFSIAESVSYDGSVIVGGSNSDNGFEAFRWTTTDGMVGLGMLPGSTSSIATGVSADGSVIVGLSGFNRAFIWDETNGMQNLSDVLADVNVDITGWRILEINEVSSDGKVIVGLAINPQGQREGFVVRVDENANAEPNCSDAVPNIASLWPANNKMKEISILGVTDPDGDNISLTITGITQDEPTNGNADGAGIGTNTAQVRAQSNGNGDGRVYVISFSADDDNGGMCTGTVNVEVPHDQSGTTVLDSGQIYDSTQS